MEIPLPGTSSYRQTIVDYLTEHGPVEDPSGRATAVLKEGVGYEKGDAGFSQLLSSMGDEGQITREIRGKRTFKISAVSATTSKSPAFTDMDYDELAAALLARTAKVLSDSQEATEPAGWARRRIDQLEARIDELSRELARARAEVKATTDERDELRGQLEAASHNLELLAGQQRSKPSRAAQRLGSDEQALLYELRGHRRRSTGHAG